MYVTMLKRELTGRKKQTIIVAAGLAIAIALVIVVSALSTGVRQAQEQALQRVYGVGTDITVTGAAQTPTGGPGERFDFGDSEGESTDGTTTLSQSRLTTERGRGTLASSSIASIQELSGVSAVTGVLSLQNMTFSGELPDRSAMTEGAQPTAPPTGGADGEGGSSFGVESFSVMGIDPSASGVGPLTSTTLVDGRTLTSDDASAKVAVLDETYASSNDLAVDGTINVGGTDLTIVGIVASSSDSADTASNVYIPLSVAYELSGETDVVSTIYVSADSASAIDSVKTSIEGAVPDSTVSTQSDLASQVSGSLSSASSLISNLGTWLSIAVLAVALLIAMLLTSSGVSRRTREFGTLKALGWSNNRVVAQVAGESMVQSIIGGLAGLVLGLGAVAIINAVSPTISASGTTAASTDAATQGGPGGMPAGGPMGQAMGNAATQVQDIVLNAPVSVWIVLLAIGLSVLGGLVAGAFGGWRAAKLSPITALHSVA